MTWDDDHRVVLAAYPRACQPRRCEFLDDAGGFSGAHFWRLETDAGPLCLRRWPSEHPTTEHLEFIQAVLWHVDQQGFHLVPVPLETTRHAGYVRHDGHLWDLSPWMPGRADFHRHPAPQRLQAAMRALAEFHLAACSFPLPLNSQRPAPGIAHRREQLQALQSGGLARLREHLHEGVWPAMMPRAQRALAAFVNFAPRVAEHVQQVAQIEARIQPCIRDIWHDHVLFEEDEVTALIDFGAMRADHVAADISRLLGSLVQDDSTGRFLGIDAYHAVRPLSDDDLRLVEAYDSSSVLLSVINWLDWVYVGGRRFARPDVVLERVDELLGRLEARNGLWTG